MNKVTEQEFMAAVAKANEPIRNLMYSDLLFIAADKFLKAHGTEVKAGETLLPVGYYLLGLRSKEGTLEELHDLKVPDVYALLKIMEDLKNNTTLSDEVNPETILPLSEEIAETEKSLESLQGIRTMAADMEAAPHTEQVYSSTQEEILTPKAAVGGAQRWESE